MNTNDITKTKNNLCMTLCSTPRSLVSSKENPNLQLIAQPRHDLIEDI